MAKHHTTVNLDEDLLREARELLGTEGVTDTLHTALQEVINFKLRMRLLKREFIAPEELERIRAWRTFEDEPQRHSESA
jgi:hypothetical protein